ncbi:hypothetical protein P879_00496 [Paragonimus westermani]|uniref:Radial spoke head protein 3 n=1 Tax=Paragonimus westermani TaxID=34504 RepID=A0A8T0DZ99_9TREM|nr:hypothetical protein P879_00496 [Paragonimus westermani]
MTDVMPPKHTEGTYTFASQPKAVSKPRKYKEKEFSEDNFDVMRYANLMYDRRVIRGNTYALHLLPAQAQTDPLELQRQVERRRRAIEQMRARDELRPSSPLPLEGRLHKPVQTELYLEQLTDLVEESDTDCQTDAFLNRPPSPLYVPAKIGADAETQIYEGDLFNFDLEVVPVLEVLVGKTVEQALLEVTEEEELANIRAQQYAFEELRQAEQVEMQRVMEHDRRLREEKDRRKQQCLLAAAREQELVDKVTAQAFAKAYLADLETTVFANLAEHGYFYDVVEHDIEEGFLPWLMAEVDEEIELENRSRLLLDLMIREVSLICALLDPVTQKQLSPSKKQPYTGLSVLRQNFLSVGLIGYFQKESINCVKTHHHDRAFTVEQLNCFITGRQ